MMSSIKLAVKVSRLHKLFLGVNKGTKIAY